MLNSREGAFKKHQRLVKEYDKKLEKGQNPGIVPKHILKETLKILQTKAEEERALEELSTPVASPKKR